MWAKINNNKKNEKGEMRIRGSRKGKEGNLKKASPQNDYKMHILQKCANEYGFLEV